MAETDTVPDIDLSPELVQKTIELGNLILAFGRVDRLTCHPDGERRETDTDHTVMLGIIACAYANVFAPRLDLGKIAQFALIHDLVEAYAGDTATFHIMSSEEKDEKEARERAALERIRKEYDDVFPWIGETLEAYESLESPEARFVKVMDKVLPKITHILNKGVVSVRLGHTDEYKESFLAHQYEKVAGSYGADQQEATALLKAFHIAMLEADLSLK